MERDEHRRQTEAFFESPEPQLKGRLNVALYTMSELHLWPDDVDSISEEQAIQCWKVVEKLRGHDFPDELRM